MQERTVPASTTGRYLIARDAGNGAGTLIGFHGYGENAELNLALLDGLQRSAGWTRCAIQALNVFYSRSTGQVVACWMTRQQRDAAIANNLRYVGDVLEQLEVEALPRPWVFVGFSQGSAMAYRAAAYGRLKPDAMIIASGDVPPELDQQCLAALPPLLICHGREDTWYTTERFDQDVHRLSAAGARVTGFAYQGGHEWHPELDAAVDAFLSSLTIPATHVS